MMGGKASPRKTAECCCPQPSLKAFKAVNVLKGFKAGLGGTLLLLGATDRYFYPAILQTTTNKNTETQQLTKQKINLQKI